MASAMTSRTTSILILLGLCVVLCYAGKDVKYKFKPKKQDFQGRDHNFTRVGSNTVTDACHKVALRRCGQNFIKVFNLLNYLSGVEFYDAQCALRKAFFICLEKVRKKPCRKRRIFANDENFKKKLADTIWTTRVCVLGMSSVDELKSPKKH